MSDEVMVDTNILVYSYESNPLEKHKSAICRELVLSCFQGNARLAISNQILAEFFYVATRKTSHPLSIEEARKLVSLLAASGQWRKVNYTVETLQAALGLAQRYGIKLWDAVITATMLENGIWAIYTENESDFRKIPGLKVINPFSKN